MSTDMRTWRRLVGLLVAVELVDRWRARHLLFASGLFAVATAAAGAAALATALRGARWAAAVAYVAYAVVSCGSPMWLLDRYALTLLLLAVAVPDGDATALSLGRAQVSWIYFDAGLCKIPAWFAGPPAVSALDAYMRHTPAAAGLRWCFGTGGLRALSRLVPLLEVGGPLALALGGRPRTVALVLLACMHCGIALTMRGAGLLSGFALCALLLWRGDATARAAPPKARRGDRRAALGLALFGAACAANEVAGSGGGAAHVLLGNRWAVYGPANDEVTWEVAPGRLRDGRVVDVWRETDVVSWDVPTADLRHGR